MADLAHINMESVSNGSSNGNGSATDLSFGGSKDSVAKSNDKTRSMIEQGGNSIENVA